MSCIICIPFYNKANVHWFFPLPKINIGVFIRMFYSLIDYFLKYVLSCYYLVGNHGNSGEYTVVYIPSKFLRNFHILSFSHTNVMYTFKHVTSACNIYPLIILWLKQYKNILFEELSNVFLNFNCIVNSWLSLLIWQKSKPDTKNIRISQTYINASCHYI